jgi:hypothetical protein
MDRSHGHLASNGQGSGRRLLIPFLAVVGLTTFVAVAMLPAEAQASCKGGFCVSGHDQGGNHIVDFTTTWTNVSHFNLGTAFGQNELGPNEREISFKSGPRHGHHLQFAGLQWRRLWAEVKMHPVGILLPHGGD